MANALFGLDWAEVRPRMEAALGDLPGVQILVYEPTAIVRTTQNQSPPTMTVGRAALIELIDRYLQGLLDPFVTLLEVHKLLYFLQEEGEQLHLRYQKAHYGPYAENLRQVLNHIEGHLIFGYADGGGSPDKRISLLPDAVESAERVLVKHPETANRINRVAALVEGFETPFGLELLSTVHWVLVHDGAKSLEEAVRLIHSWNISKQKFSQRQIAIAADVLKKKDWVTA